MNEPFSFKEVINATKKTLLKKPEFLSASDGVELAYYSFVPPDPKAVIIFYHGGGIWSNKLYHYMAYELCNKYSRATYLIDIRGHGNSQGPRGDSPSGEQVWNDVTSAINVVKNNHPHIPVFLSGHSSGAGLLLNYSSWNSLASIEGYIFLAPFLGPRSPAIKGHGSSSHSFIKKVRRWVFVLNALSGGNLGGHIPAIFFNYSDEIKKSDPLILSYYTCAMSQAVTPSHADQLFQMLTVPTALYIGSDDEQFKPDEVVRYKELVSEKIKEKSAAFCVPHATHLSIILAAPHLIDAYITTLLKP